MCFSYNKILMSFSVVPAGRSAAATTIPLSVMRRLPVAPLGRKIGTYSLLVRELSVAGCEGFDGFAQNVLSGFGDDLFGRLAVLRDGVGASVSALACSGLASGGYVSDMVEEALSHV